MSEEEKKELTQKNEDITSVIKTGGMEYVFGESIMLFSHQMYHHKKYRPFYGIGKVIRIVKGEKADLLYVRFGIFETVHSRLVVVYENTARRQILTLKRGHCVQVYGMCRYFTTEFTDVTTKERKKRIRLGLYASSLIGWYVPTMMDVRKMPTNEDLVAPSEKEKEIQQTFEDVLNEFLTGKGEKE